MSLINDALKRARHQALEQEADGSAVSYRAVPAHSRSPGRPWLPYVIGGGVVAVVLLTISVLRREEGPESGIVITDPSSSVSASSPTVQEIKPSAAEDVAEPEPRSEPRIVASSPPPHGDSTMEPAGEPGSRAVPPLKEQSANSGSVSRAAKGRRGREDETPAPPVAEQPTGARLEDGRIYLRRVVASDGGEVILGGIAYSEARPNAVINGKIVTPGDMIAGFTVVAITVDHVELETDGVRILVTLH